MNMDKISMDDLRELAIQMKASIGTLGDATVETVYAEPISILTDIWNYAHKLGHEDERACAEAERNSEPHGYTFAEVVKARNRMGEETDCSECPLNGKDCCEFVDLNSDDKIAEFENSVMSWAETHPEMRYPTWREWQNENFPNATVNFKPCYFDARVRCPEDGSCTKCANAEIPESIAVKLGIKKDVIK